MPTLTLRAVGVSYILEGLAPSGLDGAEILEAMSERFGPAVAAIGPTQPLDAIILDRKAATWDELRAWVEAWVERRGCQYVSWADDGRAQGTAATLHFHL